MNTTETVTVRLPARYAQDWYQRCGEEGTAEFHMTSWKAKDATLTLDRAALADLISDARHYTGVMASEFTTEGSGGIVRSARATLARLDKAGLL